MVEAGEYNFRSLSDLTIEFNIDIKEKFTTS